MDANLKQVRDFFGMSIADFRKEYQSLTEQDKKDLKVGIGNGSLTY